MRRPTNLPNLCLGLPSTSLREDIRTPIPFTPVVVPEYPLAMTPDTASFSLGPFSSMPDVGPSGSEALQWTEDEEGIIQSYLANPPRLIRNQYPPGSLPPASALNEITTQIIQSTAHMWNHDWTSTRRKVFSIARAESMEATGGHRRKTSDIISAMLPVADGSSRIAFEGLGGNPMDRQMHSMDSLYDAEGRSGFSEALRLSSTLQNTAKDSQATLTSGDGLSSPMAFTFNFASSSAGRKSSFPFSSSASAVPRPASLLQRGRSFTSEDFAKTFQMSGLADAEEVIADHDESSGTSSPSQAEMQRSASSPTSSFSCSPPSSISSLAMSEESDRLEPETDIEPYTPLNQKFPHNSLMLRNPSDSSSTSNETTPGGNGSQTPAITLTADSPSGTSPTDTSKTPRLMTLNDSPTPAFAALSLDGPSHLTYPTPSSSSSSSSTSTLNSISKQGIKRSIKPVLLSRSFSDPCDINAVYHHSSDSESVSHHQLLPSGRHYKRKKPMGLSSSKFRTGPGLSVNIPSSRSLSAIHQELRSPFEPKPLSQ